MEEVGRIRRHAEWYVMQSWHRGEPTANPITDKQLASTYIYIHTAKLWTLHCRTGLTIVVCL